MNVNLNSVLLLLSLVCFILAAFGVRSPRLNLIAAGLACLTASLLF